MSFLRSLWLFVTGQSIAKSGLVLMARILGEDATPITQATLSTIDYAVYDKTAAAVIGTGALTISSVVFDALQTDARWDKDTSGYNFRWTVPASLLQTGDHRYRVDVRFTPLTGQPFIQPFEFDLQAAYVS